MAERWTFMFLHVLPRVIGELCAEVGQRPTPRFWDLLYQHEVKTFTPDETAVIWNVTWLSSEGDVMWENTIDWLHTADRRGWPPMSRVFLDAEGAALALAKFERGQVDRECVIGFASQGNGQLCKRNGWDDFVWRTFGEFVALLQRAAADHERLLVGFVFSEPPAAD
jgi:hypothetical protein